MTPQTIAELIQADPRYAVWMEGRRLKERQLAERAAEAPKPAAAIPLPVEETPPAAPSGTPAETPPPDTQTNHCPAELRLKATQRREYDAVRYNLGYDTEGLHESVSRAFWSILWWINDIMHGETARRRWVTLYGKSGCGKTHLARAAIACLKANGRRAQCWNWVTLRERLLDGEHPGLMEQVQGLPYLALDDIGAEYTASEKSAELSASLLYRVLEARLGKWTLITSNLPPDRMPDVRITSRLFRGLNKIVDMSKADDYCLKLRKGGEA